jgi:pilus assembly protein Flp/PilA
MLKFFNRLLKDKSGVTAIEYGLIASLIAVAIVATVAIVGQDLNTTFQNVANNL